MEEFILPEDTRLECAILNDVISDPSLIKDIRPIITPDMFASQKCRSVWNCILGMYDNHEDIDLLSVSARSDRAFIVDKVISSETSSTAAFGHARALRSIHLRRKAYLLGQQMLSLSQEEGDIDGQILSLPAQIKEELEKNMTISTTRPLSEVLNNLAEEWQAGGRKKLPTLIYSLDRLTFGGFGKGNLVVLAARPSVGKTAFMLQLARNFGRQGLPTLMLSLEMTNEDLAERLVYSTGEVNPRDIAAKRIDWAAFERALQGLSGQNMFFDDTVSTIDEVCNSITMNAQQGKCNIAFVDYLGLMSSPDAKVKLYQQISEMTKRLKKLAKNLGIPIVLLSQLNRNMENESRPPRLSDLRDSGSIEQDADIVLMLERLEGDIIRMWVRKVRGGVGGDIYIDLHRDETYTNFTEIDKDHGEIA